MKKRIIAALLAGILTLSLLTGCSSDKFATDPTVDSSAISEPAVSETTLPLETTVAPMETEATVPEDDPGVTEPSETEAEEKDDIPETLQRRAVNMLNYMTVLTQEINASAGSRVYLDSVKTSLKDNLALSAIDRETQQQINNLWRTVDEYCMISVKRERLEYLYEQSMAQAMREAVPNPLGLLSAVQSGNALKAVASVLYMAIDAEASYKRAATQADMEYIKSGWELDDAEAKELSNSQLNLLNYMINMSRNNGFPDEWALKPHHVEDFVEWTNKDNLVSKINWLEDNEKTYREFRTYWLELAQCYYEAGEFEKCLAAIEKYEDVATHIFDKDFDLAKTLPMAILSAKQTMSEAEYVKYADQFISVIKDNCDSKDWGLRYFVSQIYIDLYSCTGDQSYLEEAYGYTFSSVNVLVYEQKALNEAYLAPIKKQEAEEGASKRQKDEVKEYNDLMKKQRETELPPVHGFFYLNCELLFALADKLEISGQDRNEIDATIHENGESIFLTEALDNRFWAEKHNSEIDGDGIEIEFNGKEITIPASCLTDRFVITVAVSDGTELSDWGVKKVKRPKNGTDCSEFQVTLISKSAKEHEYAAGEVVTITVLPVSDAADHALEFRYEVVETKALGIIKGIAFERIIE